MIKPFDCGGNVWRGPEPSVDFDFDILAKLAITDVIDLEARPFDVSGAHREFQAANVLRHGMRLWPIPMMPILPPRPSQLELSISILQLGLNQGLLNNRVYVHCKEGVDRTGLVIAAWQVRYRGLQVDAAISDMIQRGFHRYRYWWWIPFLRKFLNAE